MSTQTEKSEGQDWLEDGFVDDEEPEFEFTIDPEDLEKKWPHDIGLSPLNCGNPDCHAKAIRKYPCDECKQGAPSVEQIRQANSDGPQTTWGDWE